MNIASPTYHQTIEQLDGAVEHFLKTGFIVLEDPKVDSDADYATRVRQWRASAPPIGKAVLRKLVRKIARDLKRPIMIAETTYWQETDGVIKVKIKKLKRHAPLMGTFLLLDQFKGQSWMADRRTAEDESTFRWINRPTEWVLYFIGDKGREQFDEWMDFIQTNPECRKALKIPTPEGEVNGTSDVARRGKNRLQRQEEGQAL